jgi:hypothetical protein
MVAAMSPDLEPTDAKPSRVSERYRVFISYSHDDAPKVVKLEQILQENGLCPMRDQNFAFGCGFHEQIKTFIAHAHVFLPVITAASSRRGWVHQEIGYAMAQNVPVLPVTVGTLPGEMLQTLHSVTIGESDEELGGLEQVLTFDVFDNLVNRYRDSRYASYRTAEFTEDRAMMFAEYANSVLDLRQTGRVRQKGALSSFHIPCSIVTDAIWQHRLGQHPKNLFRCRVLREERLALTKHQQKSGCRLIINPSLEFGKFGLPARLTRLRSLVAFLEGTTDELAQVALNEEMSTEENVTIVGDWFAAESVSARIGHGYRQTIFTRHAPSMRSRIELFDQEFHEQLAATQWRPETSRQSAIEYLRHLIAQLEAQPPQA